VTVHIPTVIAYISTLKSFKIQRGVLKTVVSAGFYCIQLAHFCKSVHGIFVCIGNLFHFRTLVIKILFFELQMSRKSP